MKINKPKFNGIHNFKEFNNYIESNNSFEALSQYYETDRYGLGLASFDIDIIIKKRYHTNMYLLRPFVILTDEHKIYNKLKLCWKIKFKLKLK